MADIIVIMIILLSTVLGARKGFSLTVISFMQWFVCLFLGIFLCGTVKDFLIDHTSLHQHLKHALTEHLQTTIQDSSTYKAIPDLFRSWIDSADSINDGISSSITDILMTIIAFLMIVFALKAIVLLLTRLSSKKYHDGLIGFFDGFLGFIFGAIRGVLLVFLVFSLLVPILSLLWPDLSAQFTASLEQSRLAHYLYEENILLVLIRDFLS